MKNSTNIFIEGKNKDVNAEFLNSKQYSDAKNLIGEIGGEDGSLIPMKGVVKYTWDKNWRDANVNLISVFNVIAVKEVPTENKIIYFLKGFNDGIAPSPPNYIDEDFILMVDSAGTIEVVMGGFDLGFVLGYEYHIDWVVVNDQQYIFWTDNGHTAPKYINVADAIADFTTAAKTDTGIPSDTDLETFIHVVKKAPALAPTIAYYTDESITHNSLFGKFFKVKYRYHYKDGSVSAFSSESKIDLQTNGIVAGVSTLNELVSNEIDFLNSSKVTYSTEYGVVSIDIAFQTDDLLGWFYENIIDLTGEYIFRNDTVLTPLGLTDLDIKYYDNVPLTALSQTFIESVLSYGGYTDGYDNVDVISFIQANYTKDYAKINRLLAEPNVAGGQIARYYVDLTPANVDTEIPVGNFYLISDFISTIFIGGEPTVAKYYLQLKIKREIADPDDFLAYVIEQIEKYGYTTNTPTGSSDSYGFNAFLDAGNSNRLTIECLIAGAVIDDAGMGWGTSFSSMHHGSQAPQIPSLKNGSEADFGIVYFDQFHRQGATNKAGSVNVVELWQQGFNETNNEFGSVGARIALYNTPPIWATSYQIVYSDRNTPNNFFLSFIGHTEISSVHYITLGTDLDYDYVMLNFADSVLMLHYQGLTGDSSVTFAAESREVKIIDITNPSGTLLAEISFDDWEYLESIAPNYNIPGTALLGCFAEIRTNAKKNTPVYYEIGETFDILNPGLSNRFHAGNVKDQEAANTSLGLIGFGSITEVPSLHSVYRATILDATLWAYPNGTPIKVENDTSGATFKGFISYHAGTPAVIVEMEQQFIGGDDYLFWISLASSSIIEVGTVYLTEERLIGDVDNLDYYYKWGTIQSVIQNYFPIPYNTIKSDDEIPLISYDDSNNLGRIQIESINFKEVYRFASLIGSQVLQADTYFFGLTSFPNTSFPFKDLDPIYGAVTALVTRDTDIVVLQETRSGRILVEKDVITTASGDTDIVVSDKVFGQYVPYMGNVGIGNTFKSLQFFKGRIYFLDKVTGDVYRLSADGLTDLSNLGMDSFFNTINFDPTFSGIEPLREEYLVQTAVGNIEVYSIVNKRWMPSFQIFPEKISRFNNLLISFKNLDFFIHEQTANYSELYDASGNLVTVIPTVSLVANDPKNQTKLYESVEITGDSLDSLQITNISTKDATSEDITALTILESSWVAKFKNGLYNDTLGTEFIGIGNPILINGNEVLFGFDINETAIAVGDKLVYFDGASVIFDGDIIGVEARKVSISGTIDGGLSDVFMVQKNSSVEGSDLRGLFLKMTLEIPITEFFRLNSISTFGGNSKLHEE